MVGLTTALSIFFGRILNFLHLQTTLAQACISGMFEISIGSSLASSAIDITGQGLAPINQRVAITSGIIAWSGLSVHCQVAAIIADTDIRLTPYLLARAYHAILATVVTLLLLRYNPVFLGSLAVPVYLEFLPMAKWAYWGFRLRFLLRVFGLLSLLLITISIIYSILRKLSLIRP